MYLVMCAYVLQGMKQPFIVFEYSTFQEVIESAYQLFIKQNQYSNALHYSFSMDNKAATPFILS